MTDRLAEIEGYAHIGQAQARELIAMIDDLKAALSEWYEAYADGLEPDGDMLDFASPCFDSMRKERDEARARIAELERDHNTLRQLYTEQTIKFQALERELAELRSSPAYHDPALERQLEQARASAVQWERQFWIANDAVGNGDDARERIADLEQELEKARAFFRKVAEGIIIAMAKEARDRIAALEGELELARQGQRDARAGMDYAISKGRGEAANFCARIDALLKERDEARRELKQAREQIHAQGRELVVAIESLRSAREVIDRRDRHGEEMEERIAALERENAELRGKKTGWELPSEEP